MTYEESISWLLSFADFERSGRFQDRPDVAPMLSLLERLGNPHLGRFTIHIAGSKGKGSVAAMVESILRSDQTKTGLYTSPHLHSYTERIRVDGQPLVEEAFAALASEVRDAVEANARRSSDRSLVTFDLLTAMAFLAFREAEVQLQVIEVGLGGRVDSTNVFDEKEIAVITPISLEHTAILGSTVEQITREKAGIITRHSTVVLAPQDCPQVPPVIAKAAIASRIVDVRRNYSWERLAYGPRSQRIRILAPECEIEADLPLLGRHQIENAATAITAVDSIYGHDPLYWPTPEVIAEGLANVRWPCRIEVLREHPLLIADGAHNRESARRLRETLVEYFTCDRALFVIGCGSDKDVDGLADELAPLASRVIAVRADHPRAMAPGRIAEAFGRLNVDIEIVNDVPNAVERALAATSGRALTLICVAGSLFVAAEARAHVLGVRT